MKVQTVKRVSASEFDARFEQKLSSADTYEEAYQQTEEEHIRLTGYKKYASYNSYRNSRQKRINR